MRESIASKGARYASEGRIVLLRVSKYKVTARARGEAEYRITFNGRRWRCTCPARGNCCHLSAVKLVCSPRRRPWWRPW